MTRRRDFSRRRFLQGTGGVALALPFLESFGTSALAQSGARPKRIIVMAYPMGAPFEHWIPNGSDGNLSLPHILAPFEPIKHKCLFLHGSTRGSVDAYGDLRYGHPAKMESAFTGTLPVAVFNPESNNNRMGDLRFGIPGDEIGGSPANGPSIETVVGRHIRSGAHSRDSVSLSVGSDRNSSGYSTGSGGFFWEGRGASVTTEYNPKKAFDDLFGGLVGSEDNVPPEIDRLQARNKSVLDAVRENFNLLRRNLGTDDKQRLDAHAQRIREIELAIRYSATCSAPLFGPGEMPSIGQNNGESDTDYMNRIFGEQNPGGSTSASMAKTSPLMVRILAHAMACDIAPVGRLAFTASDNPFFGIPSVDDEIGNYDGPRWHTLVHHAGNINGRTGQPSRPSDGGAGYYAPELLDGTRFYWEQMAELCILLDQIPEGANGETALDNTLVVMTSDLGEGSGHGPHDTCFAMAGNFAGGRGGRALDLGNLGYHDSHVLVSIANIFDARDENGAPIDEFGLGDLAQGGVSQTFQS